MNNEHIANHTLEVTGAPDLKFEGEKIAGTSNSADRGHSEFSGETGRWTSLALYRTTSGKYVCHRIDHTQWAGERDYYAAAVCQDTPDVLDFFGFSDLAKELYHLAKIPAAVVID